MPAFSPDVWVPLARLLAAALLGGGAGAALATLVHRRVERGSAPAGMVEGQAREPASEPAPEPLPEPLPEPAPEPAREPARGTGPTRGNDGATLRPVGSSERDDAGWRTRCEELATTARSARRRVEALLAERQAASERQAVLEGELRSLRRERDFAAASSAPPARAARADTDAPRLEGGVPVLNRRVESAGRVPDIATIDAHYPMLAESELPDRSESLRLEDLLEGGTG